MIHGIIVCHGDLANCLIATVERILGPAEGITALSNSGLSPQALYDQLLTVIQDNPEADILVMVDLRGGSCWTSARMLGRDFPDLKVVSGVNLPMLISFLTKRQSLDYVDLVDVVKKDAGKSIVVD